MDKLKRVLSGRDAEEPSGLAEVALPPPGEGPAARPRCARRGGGAATPEPARADGPAWAPSALPRGSRRRGMARFPRDSREGAWADTARQSLRGSFRPRYDGGATSKQVSLLFFSSFPGYRCDFLRLGHPSERFHCVFCDWMSVLDLGKDFLLDLPNIWVSGAQIITAPLCCCLIFRSLCGDVWLGSS